MQNLLLLRCLNDPHKSNNKDRPRTGHHPCIEIYIGNKAYTIESYMWCTHVKRIGHKKKMLIIKYNIISLNSIERSHVIILYETTRLTEQWHGFLKLFCRLNTNVWSELEELYP